MLFQGLLPQFPIGRVFVNVQVVLGVGDNQKLQLLLVKYHEVTLGDGSGRYPAPLDHNSFQRPGEKKSCAHYEQDGKVMQWTCSSHMVNCPVVSDLVYDRSHAVVNAHAAVPYGRII